MQSVDPNNTDHVGIQINTFQGSVYNCPLHILAGPFTGLHKCFTSDENCNKDEPQLFQDTYIGRTVVSTGKIATDFRTLDYADNGKDWEISMIKKV
jgi:hypothetical protein